MAVSPSWFNWRSHHCDAWGCVAGEGLTKPRVTCITSVVGGPPHPAYSSGGDGGAAQVVPPHQTNHRVNLRRVLHISSWNILTLSEDHWLSRLSDKLSRLRMDIVGLSDTRRPARGEINSSGFTYYWSGMNNGARLKGVGIGVQQTAAIYCWGYSGWWAYMIEAEAHLGLHVCCYSVHSYRGLWGWRGVLHQTGLCARPVPSPPRTHSLSWQTPMLPLPLREKYEMHLTILKERGDLVTIYELMNNLEEAGRKDLILRRKGDVRYLRGQEKIAKRNLLDWYKV